MYEAAARCGDPQKSYLSIHVAGTNGKGSTCAYIESVLRHAGYRTGLYTSPHITDFEERFKVDGVDVDESVWFEVYKEQEEVINDIGLTFFEAATLMSFEIFKRAGVQFAVFETGMGGRLDATNIIMPEVTVITKLALDHKEYLGDTIEAIAGEKLGIVKAGVPLVMLNPVYQSIKQLAVDRCKGCDSELTFVDTDEADKVIYGDGGGGVSFIWNNQRYDLSLTGGHQIQNALLALNAIKKIAKFDYPIVYAGMKSALLPGRFQIININGQTIVIDVGHNPDAAAVLVDTLKLQFPNRRVSFVIGMMRDKDIASTLEILAGYASAFYFAKPQTERAADPVDLSTLTNGKFTGECTVKQNMGDALQAAIDAARGSSDIICVTGSFYTVSETLKILK
ncbi:MAG: bifunctional folylpolyglutamate synthase/dihydrofolate synthase [Chitinispirillales bacterium]|nr:bifunctional folylpolyglutamate synthase/dihydrofolate synthase [Chitinispirillales bacterium]